MFFTELKQKISILLRPPRQLKFTKDGKRFIFVTLAVGVAAINTGNNLLYLILAMLLSMIILSGMLSESTLRMVNIRRSLPGEAFAGKPFLVRISASNGKRRLPSISLSFQEKTAEGGELYFIKIPPGKSINGSYHLALDKRGVHVFGSGRLYTRFPFGLFLKSKDADTRDELVIFPRLLEGEEFLLQTGISGDEVESALRGRGTDLYGLRGYIQGDDVRMVHWKTSARLSRLYVKEFSREDARRVIIFLDDCPRGSTMERFERAVSIAATLAAQFINKNYQVGMATSSDEIPPGIGPAQLHRILRFLSFVEMNEAGDKSGLWTRLKTAQGVLILADEDPYWKGREGAFAKVIKA